MKILALDLGTKTGFTHNANDAIVSGTWNLATAREVREWGQQRLTRRNDPRIQRLSDRMKILDTHWDLIIYEDVLFASSTFAVQLWASLRAAIWLTFPGKFVDCLAVGTLKKHATGNGAATKEMMAAALRKQFPGLWEACMDDNAVDACWLFLWAQQHIKL